MKILNKQTFIVAVAATLISVTGCKKYLVEKPESQLYPSYFTTAGGVQAAVTGVYSDLRNTFAGEGIVYVYDGTDQTIPGGSSSSTGVLYNNFTNINSSNGPDVTPLYVDINTLNGVIQFASAITDPVARAQYVAQAQFLRGWIYFYLVQTYGGTTATQQSGMPLHTTFITAASTSDAPAKLSDLYALIISDFTSAAANLPNTVTTSDPFSANGVGKTGTAAAANAYLAKAYLTRGYTEAAVSGDFQQAANITQALITNQSTYGLGLWQDYNDAMKPANDFGKEVLFTLDFGGLTDPTYTGYQASASGGTGFFTLPFLARFNYVSTGIDNVPGIDQVPQKMSTKSGMFRDVYNGRPFIRMAPNKPYTMDVAFADQVNDTRYDATFQTFWICNTSVAAGTNSSGGLKGQLISTTPVSTTSYIVPTNGDTAILMPSQDVTLARRDAFKGLIVTPKQFNNTNYPTVKKFDDITRTGMNDFSTRPLCMMRFSEVYLMNAEANYMLGNVTAAATSLNVIRQRAAFRTVADGATVPKNQFSSSAATVNADNAAHAAAMTLTPAQLAQLAIPNNTTSTSTQCGMDLILDEYTREYYGDPRRWYDLVRTQQFVRRNQMYNVAGGPNVKAFHARWPIPQALINAVLTGPKYPQNNGY